MAEGPDDCVELSARLVALHAALLGCERQAYEARHGRTETRQLFRQVFHHEQSAWLRSLSAMIARIDGSPRRGQLLHFLKNVSMIGGLAAVIVARKRAAARRTAESWLVRLNG